MLFPIEQILQGNSALGNTVAILILKLSKQV